MESSGHIPDDLFILGSLFTVSNMLDTFLDHELAEFNATTKQWFLSIIVGTLFKTPPSLNDAASIMGSSHQNVKQIALKLQEKGLLLIKPDAVDARISRLVTTDQFNEFWSKSIEKGNKFTKRLFEDIKPEEIKVTRDVLQKLWANLEKIK